MATKDLEVESRFQQVERRAYAAEERLNALEQRVSAVSQLTKKLDEFAAGVAIHSARLDELAVTHQTAIGSVATSFETKMAFVNETLKEVRSKI